MAINMPPKLIFTEVFNFSKAAIESHIPAARHGAVLTLLMVTEGCAGAICKKLPDILQVPPTPPLFSSMPKKVPKASIWI